MVVGWNPRMGSGSRREKPKCDLLEVYNDNEKEQLIKRCKQDLTPLIHIMKTNNNEDEDGNVFEFVDDQTLVYQNLLDISGNKTVNDKGNSRGHKVQSQNQKQSQQDEEDNHGVTEIDIDEI